MEIGEIIKLQRKQRNLTQKQLSELTGIAQITIRQYEAGKYVPKVDNLSKIAKVLDCPLASFLQVGQSISSYDPEDDLEDTLTKKEDGTLSRQIRTSISFSDRHLTQSEQTLLHYFSKLNEAGRNETIKRIEQLTRLAEFTSKPSKT